MQLGSFNQSALMEFYTFEQHFSQMPQAGRAGLWYLQLIPPHIIITFVGNRQLKVPMLDLAGKLSSHCFVPIDSHGPLLL